MIECDGTKSTEERVSARVFIHFNSEAMTGRVIIYLQSERNVNQKHAKRKKNKALRPQLLHLGGNTRTILATYTAVALFMNLCTFDPYWALR